MDELITLSRQDLRAAMRFGDCVEAIGRLRTADGWTGRRVLTAVMMRIQGTVDPSSATCCEESDRRRWGMRWRYLPQRGNTSSTLRVRWSTRAICSSTTI
jgi:hypothetical protein